MDELIREIEELQDEALAMMEQFNSLYFEGQVLMAATILKLAREAKRRMAEHEPAWDLR